ncbi:hypothetical protein BDV97DRAFT_423412 [Delphinella strobiligena]|nr:hypothetical protein BDV97DRAFT_423412 [Delphinella strobiligena]
MVYPNCFRPQDFVEQQEDLEMDHLSSPPPAYCSDTATRSPPVLCSGTLPPVYTRKAAPSCTVSQETQPDIEANNAVQSPSCAKRYARNFTACSGASILFILGVIGILLLIAAPIAALGALSYGLYLAYLEIAY